MELATKTATADNRTGIHSEVIGTTEHLLAPRDSLAVSITLGGVLHGVLVRRERPLFRRRRLRSADPAADSPGAVRLAAPDLETFHSLHRVSRRRVRREDPGVTQDRQRAGHDDFVDVHLVCRRP